MLNDFSFIDSFCLFVSSYSPSDDVDSDDEDVYNSSSSNPSSGSLTSSSLAAFPQAFDLDSQCPDGHVALVYTSLTQSAIYFQDCSTRWFYVADRFEDYHRLLLMHVGIRGWQYAFTDVGLDQNTKVSRDCDIRVHTSASMLIRACFGFTRSNGFIFSLLNASPLTWRMVAAIVLHGCCNPLLLHRAPLNLQLKAMLERAPRELEPRRQLLRLQTLTQSTSLQWMSWHIVYSYYSLRRCRRHLLLISSDNPRAISRVRQLQRRMKKKRSETGSWKQ